MSPFVVAAALTLAIGACAPSAAKDFADDRRAMLETVAAHARQGPAPIGERTMAAVAAVPREEFVPAELRDEAYRDTPLPIGHGQTISQPYVVALMTELADVGPDDVVLEVGTGSGYQAAVLAKLARKVFTIEIVEPLGREAEQTLRRLGYANVEVRVGDGYAGWPEHAPFDAIVVTAAPGEIPPPLLEQLAPGGKLVIPVGGTVFDQQLTVVEKDDKGAVAKREVLSVRFVPFTRER